MSLDNCHISEKYLWACKL